MRRPFLIAAGVLVVEFFAHWYMSVTGTPCVPTLEAGVSLCLSEHWEWGVGQSLSAWRFVILPTAAVVLSVCPVPRRLGTGLGLAIGGVLANATEALTTGFVLNWLRVAWGPGTFDVSAVVVNLADVAIVVGFFLSSLAVASAEVRTALVSALSRGAARVRLPSSPQLGVPVPFRAPSTTRRRQ